MSMRNLSGIVLAITLCAPIIAFAQDPVPPAPTPTAAPAVTAEPEADLAPATVPDATSADTGTVIFFREKKFSGAAIRFKVREGGKELGKLSNGAYFTVQLPAGKHEFAVHSEAKDVLTMEVEPGETYYVIGSISIGVLAGRPNLSPSDQATFEKMKAELKDVTGQDIDSGASDK